MTTLPTFIAIFHFTVLGQSYSWDRRQPGNLSNNPISMINHPSTTRPPENTGNLTEFANSQIVAFKEKSLPVSEIGKILSRPKSTVLRFYNQFQKGNDVKNLPMPGRHEKLIPEHIAAESETSGRHAASLMRIAQ